MARASSDGPGERRARGGLRRALLALTIACLAFPATALAELDRAQAEAALARLSDTEVREMLLRELTGRDAAADRTREEFNPAVIMYRMQRGVGTLSAELSAIFGAAAELPDIFPRAWASFVADRRAGGLLWFVVALGVSMGAGGLCAWLVRAQVRRLTRDARAAHAPSVRTRCKLLAWRFAVHMLYVAVFAGISALVFVVGFDDNQRDRIAFLFYLAAACVLLTSIAASVAFHAPHDAALRLPEYTDAEARSLHRAVLVTAGFGAFAYFTCALFGTLGIVGEVHELLLILVALATTSLLIRTVLSGREAISRDIASGAPGGSARSIFAALWPWFFASTLAVMIVALIVRELLYDFVPYGASLFTVGAMATVPALDAVLYREARRLDERGDRMHATLVGGGRFAFLVLVASALCAAWRINPFAAAGGGLGAALVATALQVGLVSVVAYALWRLSVTVIDQKIAEEDAQLAEQGVDAADSEIGGVGLSRMRTLLPLLKRTLQVTILSMGVMIALASFGVDIAPLLAGAGVVGLAIGFGSQTLVRDIVSGAFFLVDDAFRIGEYIDVGSVKGSVEKMSVRSVRLRHHRGAVHTVPFGEIKTLTNYSRDWTIMKLQFRVPFDTDLDKVRKLIKATGLALAEHEDIKDDFIQPFKSQGATEADDYGFVISTKFMSKPGKQFLIRRHAVAAVQRAFAENGIEFATPKVEVSIDAGGDDAPGRDRPASQRDEAAAAAAIAPVLGRAEPAAE